MEKKTAEKLALQMAAQVGDSDTARRLKWARDPAYWNRLIPSLAMSAKPPQESVEATALEESGVQEIAKQFRTEGYFQIEPILTASLMERMRGGIEELRKAGWPSVFSWVYDECWTATGGESLRRVLSAILGTGYGQLPHIWTHYVSPSRNASGWPPHKDGNDRPGRITVWVPISDATIDNGCIYLIPKDRTPEPFASKWFERTPVSRPELSALLQQSRAVPALSGSVLGWDLDVIHWGSARARPGEPRISISMGYVAADVELHSDERPVIDVEGALPTFEQRLRAIGQALLTYEKFDPIAARNRDLAQALFELPDPPASPRRDDR